MATLQRGRYNRRTDRPTRPPTIELNHTTCTRGLTPSFLHNTPTHPTPTFLLSHFSTIPLLQVPLNGAKVSYQGPIPTSYTWHISDDRITLRLTKVTCWLWLMVGGAGLGGWPLPTSVAGHIYTAPHTTNTTTRTTAIATQYCTQNASTPSHKPPCTKIPNPHSARTATIVQL